MNKWAKLKKMLEKPYAAYTFAICSGVILFFCLSHIDAIWHFFQSFYHIIYPVVIGIVIAYILDPIVKFWELKIFGKLRKRSAARLIGVLLSMFFLIMIIVILLVAMIPQLVSSVQMFVSNLSGYSRSLDTMLNDLQAFAAQYKIDISAFTAPVVDIYGNVTENLPAYVNKLLNTTITYGVEFFNLIISFIIAIYVLMDKERLLSGGDRLWKALTSEKFYKTTNSFFGRCNSIMMQYILFDLLDGILIGFLNAAFMLIVGYPYVPLISVIVGVTNLAPTFGPILGAIIGSLILVLINPWYALGFLIFTIILQTMDGYVIKPKLFGGQLGIPSIWILIALIVFGRMWGVVGILLAIPFAAIIDIIYKDFILDWLERRKKKTEAAKAAALSAAYPSGSAPSGDAQENTSKDFSKDRQQKNADNRKKKQASKK